MKKYEAQGQALELAEQAGVINADRGMSTDEMIALSDRILQEIARLKLGVKRALYDIEVDVTPPPGWGAMRRNLEAAVLNLGAAHEEVGCANLAIVLAGY